MQNAWNSTSKKDLAMAAGVTNFNKFTGVERAQITPSTTALAAD
jgi:hypothetical protein